MSNVVSLTPRKVEKKELVIPASGLPSEVVAFNYYLQEWATLNGVDINSVNFKYESATISVLLQGMLATKNAR
jgi:hypothetical protein